MNAKEAADFLRISEASFRQITPSLPRHKGSRMGYLYPRSELIEWLISQGDEGAASPSPPGEARKPEKQGKRKRVRRLILR